MAFFVWNEIAVHQDMHNSDNSLKTPTELWNLPGCNPRNELLGSEYEEFNNGLKSILFLDATTVDDPWG